MNGLPRVSLDTNILAYAAGVRRTDADEPKIARAGSLLAELAELADIAVAIQVYAELHTVLIRRLRLDRADAAGIVGEYMALGERIATTGSCIDAAFALAAMHGLQTYDAIILVAAAEAGCETLYSEDMQHGFVWCGVKVINPFR